MQTCWFRYNFRVCDKNCWDTLCIYIRPMFIASIGLNITHGTQMEDYATCLLAHTCYKQNTWIINGTLRLFTCIITHVFYKQKAWTTNRTPLYMYLITQCAKENTWNTNVFTVFRACHDCVPVVPCVRICDIHLCFIYSENTISSHRKILCMCMCPWELMRDKCLLCLMDWF